MKLYVLSIFFLLVVTTNNAQNLTVPLSGYNTMDDTFLHADVDYVKDLDGILNKFIGTWKGSNADYQYEYRVSKTIERVDDKYDLDILVIKYLIKDSSGAEIMNTLNLADDHDLVIGGLYFRGTVGSYYLHYGGEDSDCGQDGTLFINVPDSNNQTKMRTALYPDRIILDRGECPDGYATQIMPTDVVVLTKQ